MKYHINKLCLGSIALCCSISVSAANFGPAIDVNNNQSKAANASYISLNDLGVGIAIWQETNGSVANIYTRTYSANSGWSATAINLNNNQLMDAQAPYISLNDSGKAIAVWQEDNGGFYNIYARIYDVSTGWSATATNLNNNQSMDAQAPYISLNASGESIAVWRELNGGNFYNIYARMYNASTGWSATAINLNNNQSVHPITIVQGTGVTAPTGFEYESISTCGDYIAVGFSSTDTTTYGFARVALLTLDSDTNTLSLSSTMTTLEGQLSVNSLARCCCCAEERPLLVGSHAQTGYPTLRVLSPDLSQEYASTVLGNNAVSVDWSCQGENNAYLTASSSENNGFQYTVKYTFTDNTLTDQIVVTR